MSTLLPIRLYLTAFCILAAAAWLNPACAQDKVILVQIDPTVEVDDDDLYDDVNEVARHNIPLSQAGVLANPAARPAGQSGYRPADCFIADYKLIYKDFTYVVSTFCTHAMKFRNSAPYTPSGDVMPSDFVFTNAALDKIERTARSVFTKDFSSYFEQMQTAEENFAGRSNDGGNVSDAEATQLIEGAADFNNPQQDTQEEAGQVEGQVDSELNNVREEDITDPVTPEQEANEEHSFDNLEQRTEQEITRPGN